MQKEGTVMDYEIWAATDGSPNASNAVATAIHLAQAFTAHLTLVAVDVSVGGYGPYRITTPTLDDQVRTLLSQALNEGAQAAQQAGIAVETRLLQGLTKGSLWDRSTAVPPLCHAIEDAAPNLVVVGSHGHGVLSSGLLGSVSDRLARMCIVDVLVVRPGMDLQGPVLVATDGSAVAMQAVSRASRLARALGVPLTVITVAEPSSTVARCHEADFSLGGAVESVLARYRTTVLNEAVQQVQVQGVTAVSVRETVGPVAPTVAQIAKSEGFSWVVVGSHGHGGWTSHVLLGSVSDRLIHLSPVSVWVVR
jgi:nucleotide-binding universal stress UspA family protein